MMCIVQESCSVVGEHSISHPVPPAYNDVISLCPSHQDLRQTRSAHETTGYVSTAL